MKTQENGSSLSRESTANNKEYLKIFPLSNSSKYSSLQRYSHETDLVRKFLLHVYTSISFMLTFLLATLLFLLGLNLLNNLQINSFFLSLSHSSPGLNLYSSAKRFSRRLMHFCLRPHFSGPNKHLNTNIHNTHILL